MPTQTPNDPDYPYVGKFIANLTFAQLRTLDCGSKRQDGYRKAHLCLKLCRASDAPAAMQLVYPGARISSLGELFAFAECADPAHQILWNIESKINAAQPNCTRGVDDFVAGQHAVFAASAYAASITVSRSE